MWYEFTKRALAVVLAVAALAGCGQRQLAVDLRIDVSGCTLSLPAGGSLLYQVSANGIAGDAGGGSFCGACLPVADALSGSDALVALLRAQAPGCGGVHPGTILGVRVTAWRVPGCPANDPGSLAFCIDGPTVLVPDGTRDATLPLALRCEPQCATSCVPTTCAQQVKDCGPISDGCNNLLECGTCKPPLRCGGSGTPNVCGK